MSRVAVLIPVYNQAELAYFRLKQEEAERQEGMAEE